MNASVTHPTTLHSDTATPWADARRLTHQLPAPLASEDVALAAAAGRTLAQPLRAATMLPGFDNAGMDGYAVRGLGPWRLTGRVLAGDTGPAAMGVGEAVEVGTGAVLPIGADRVVPYEDADRDGDLISGTGGKAHIRRAGEYVHAGHELLPVGHVLTAAAVGLAASVGLDTVTVRRRPRVQLLVTGDEVVRAGVPPHGHVRDAIAPMLGPLRAAWGADQLTTRWVPDHPHDTLTTDVEAALDAGDVIVVCGSSSVGPADTLHRTLTALSATVHVNGVNCRPGHPQALARLGDRWLVGLPGNPHAALVAAVTLLQPALRGLLGQPLPEPQHTALTGRIPAGGNTTRLVPVRREHSHATVLDGSHPGYLGAAALADALAVIPPTWQPDQPVELIPIT